MDSLTRGRVGKEAMQRVSTIAVTRPTTLRTKTLAPY